HHSGVPGVALDEAAGLTDAKRSFKPPDMDEHPPSATRHPSHRSALERKGEVIRAFLDRFQKRFGGRVDDRGSASACRGRTEPTRRGGGDYDTPHKASSPKCDAPRL